VTVVVGLSLGASCVVVASVATGVVTFSLTVSEAILTVCKGFAFALLTGVIWVAVVKMPSDGLVVGV
jgi:hypothetical protein